MSASNDALEASIPTFQLQKRATLSHFPPRLQRVKDWQTRNLFAMGKVPPFSYPSICYVTMSAFNDTVETSISAQCDTKEGEVASSPSPLVNSKRLANRYSWKRSLQHSKWRGYEERGHFTHGKQITCLPIFYSLQVGRAMRQHRPLL